MATALDQLTRILTALDPGQLTHWYGPNADPTSIAEQLRALVIIEALADDDEDGDPVSADPPGPGVYQPETNPAKIATAEEHLDKIRERLNRAPW